ncbi:MAG: hypothetical protein WCG92_12365 [Hyphomicrobiales bacterium]|nr:hypothetical protein [Alphaproteobacteria bacterium]
MNDQLRAYLNDHAQAVDDDVRRALARTHGDALTALRLCLTVKLSLSEERERLQRQTSRGYSRRK